MNQIKSENGESSAENKKVQELEEEKKKLTAKGCATPNVMELINDEINRLQGKQKGTPKYLEVIHDRPIKLSVKVLIPTKEFPNCNFKGKLLGPQGSTMKSLQEETMTKMAVRGRGSMWDKKKEAEFRTSGDSKYEHLNEELHVDVSTVAPSSEAYARISYALVEISKLMTPERDDGMEMMHGDGMHMMHGDSMHMMHGNGMMVDAPQPLMRPPARYQQPQPLMSLPRVAPVMRGGMVPRRGREATIRRPAAAAVRRTTASTPGQLYQRRVKPALLTTPAAVESTYLEEDDDYELGDVSPRYGGVESYSRYTTGAGGYKSSIYEKSRMRATPY